MAPAPTPGENQILHIQKKKKKKKKKEINTGQ